MCGKVLVNEICHEVVDTGVWSDEVSVVCLPGTKQLELTFWVEAVVNVTGDMSVFPFRRQHLYVKMHLQEEDLSGRGWIPVGALCVGSHDWIAIDSRRKSVLISLDWRQGLLDDVKLFGVKADVAEVIVLIMGVEKLGGKSEVPMTEAH